MILLFIFYIICVAADEQVEEVKQNCNCSRLLHEDTTITDPPPTLPTTSFTCWGRYDGYYADTEVDCTIFHYCQTWYFPTGLNETVKWDFACPQSTIFNQKILSCTLPNISFDCQESPNYYWVNWLNLTESTTLTPTQALEYSTSDPNIGQQLIVGGLQPQEVPILESVPQESSNVFGTEFAQPSSSETNTPLNFLISDLESQSSNASDDKVEANFEQYSTSETTAPQDVPASDSTPQKSVNESDIPESGSGQSLQSESIPADLINKNGSEAIHFPV